MSYFDPEFTLGLTATPERSDGEDLLSIFRNVAHKLDLKTAVELGMNSYVIRSIGSFDLFQSMPNHRLTVSIL